LQIIIVQSKISKQISQILEAFSDSNINFSEFNLELPLSFISQIKKQINFSEEHYTRTCIFKNDILEVLLLAWNPMQITEIHNHQGNACYWKVLSGSITEKTFEWDEANKQLEYREEKILSESESGFDNNELFFHQILNNSDKPAITIHIYSKPLKTCLVYDSQTKATDSKILTNHYEQFDFLETLSL